MINYVAAVNHAFKEIHSPKGPPISVRLLNDCHHILMQGVRGATKQPCSCAVDLSAAELICIMRNRQPNDCDHESAHNDKYPEKDSRNRSASKEESKQ